MMRTYIAGPMTGIPLYNFPAFDAAASRIDDPVNPAELDRLAGCDPLDLPPDHDWSTLPDGMTRRELFDRDMAALRDCDAIYMLPGWRQSTGATAEYHAAKWLGLDVIDEHDEAAARKATPIYRGCLMYFPDAIAEVARLSHAANEQHNPGEPMHWAREKSTDHPDCLVRHLMDAGTVDSDGQRHTAKVAWRALAMLQLELEQA